MFKQRHAAVVSLIACILFYFYEFCTYKFGLKHSQSGSRPEGSLNIIEQQLREEQTQRLKQNLN